MLLHFFIFPSLSLGSRSAKRRNIAFQRLSEGPKVFKASNLQGNRSQRSGLAADWGGGKKSPARISTAFLRRCGAKVTRRARYKGVARGAGESLSRIAEEHARTEGGRRRQTSKQKHTERQHWLRREKAETRAQYPLEQCSRGVCRAAATNMYSAVAGGAHSPPRPSPLAHARTQCTGSSLLLCQLHWPAVHGFIAHRISDTRRSPLASYLLARPLFICRRRLFAYFGGPFRFGWSTSAAISRPSVLCIR